MTGVLIAEDLLLLVTDDESGRLTAPATNVDYALAGATLVELTLLNRVTVSDKGRIVVQDPAPTADAVLDAALATVGKYAGKRPSAVIRPLSKKLRPKLYERLVGGGQLSRERYSVLGIFPSSRWPTQDASHENEVRRAVTQALVQGSTPDDRTAAVIALVHALRIEHKVVDRREYDVSTHQLRKRAGEIAEGDWAAAAVRAAINEMIAAVTVAVAAGGAASAGGS